MGIVNVDSDDVLVVGRLLYQPLGTDDVCHDLEEAALDLQEFQSLLVRPADRDLVIIL